MRPSGDRTTKHDDIAVGMVKSFGHPDCGAFNSAGLNPSGSKRQVATSRSWTTRQYRPRTERVREISHKDAGSAQLGAKASLPKLRRDQLNERARNVRLLNAPRQAGIYGPEATLLVLEDIPLIQHPLKSHQHDALDYFQCKVTR